jgi:protein phosphatase 1L
MLSNNTDLLDADLLLRLEKILPISTKYVTKTDSEIVPTIDSEIYLESNGCINYNKLITDQVLATDKLLTEAAKKTRNIAGKKILAKMSIIVPEKVVSL